METLETCEAKMQQSKECCIILYFYQLRPFQCWNRFNELIFCVMFQRCTGSAVSAIRIAWQMLAGRGSWSRPRCRRESYNKVNISYDKDKKKNNIVYLYTIRFILYLFFTCSSRAHCNLFYTVHNKRRMTKVDQNSLVSMFVAISTQQFHFWRG